MARYDVNGRVVLITGGATGIGFETAKQLERRGAQLALVDFDAAGVERAAAELGDRAEPFVADVTDSDSIGAAVGAVRDHFGGIDVVLAGAGISGKPQPMLVTSDEDWERVIQTNLIGVWRTLRAALPDVIERKGYLLPIASLAAAVPVPMASAYSASKHAVHGLARSIRIELRHTGVDVGVGYFSVIDTRMTDMAFDEPVVQRSMRGFRGRLTRPAPVHKAGAVLVRAIEKRGRRAYYPPWVGPVLNLHGLGGPIEALVARDRRLAKNWDKAVEESRQEASKPEELTKP